jgi:hypothetical protein
VTAFVTAGARSILRDHVLYVTAVAVVLLIQLAFAR